MLRVRFAQLAIFTAALCSLRDASAAPKNEGEEISAELDKVLATDVAEANYGAARRRLQALHDRCRRRSGICSNKTLILLNVELGIVLAQTGQRQAAVASFSAAFDIDASAQIPPNADVTEGIKRLFADAHAEYEAKHPHADDPYRVTWQKKEAALLFVDALAAQKRKEWPVCIDKARAALDIEDNSGARMHLAECLDGNGKLVDAAREVQTTLQRARDSHDEGLTSAATALATSLVKRFGRVKFEVPSNVGNLRVTFDDRLVPPERLKTTVVVDPGDHKMHAEGTVGGGVIMDSQQVTVPEGGSVTVKIAPTARAMTAGQYECILNAKSETELQECLEKSKSTVSIRAGAEFSGYVDTQRVNVITPAINAGIAAPTKEWNVNASYLVDVVSAASADVVSTASPRFTDTRHAVALSGGYTFAPVSFGAAADLSIEHDYVSRGVGATIGVDLFDKQFTPEVGYGIAYDTIGRTGTPFDVFSNNLTTNTVHVGGTIVLSPKRVLVLGGWLAVETGDQSKPYRYIPMFAPGTDVPNHASTAFVNAIRLPERPLEQLPLERDRYALAARYIDRIRSNATLRLEERLYTDNWGMYASTTDVRYLIDVTPRLLLWTAIRFHAQTGTSFYERAYFASGAANGQVKVPIVRTTDRELGPLLSPSPGLGGRFALTPTTSKVQVGMFLQGTLLLSKYFESLYTGSRTAVYGTVGFDTEIP